ncbi:hypothetical protein MNBD_GAMMA22-1097 [hydrothermal vent metagenome]|uniref:Uncharacterized protein n=1 Tax=hydrothermal vent metagenome TaxID=652676 RepID=A0A3B1AEE5_9ZZZZ
MKKHTLKVLIIAISSLLFISTSYAGSSRNSHSYQGHNSGYNKHHSAPRYNYGHSNYYRGHSRSYRSHDQYRVHRHNSECGHYYNPQTHSYEYSNGHVSNSVTYIDYDTDDHNVATAIGVVTGAAIAVGLDH